MKLRVNPARAGMIPTRRPARCAQSSKPRASGDDPLDPEIMTVSPA